MSAFPFKECTTCQQFIQFKHGAKLYAKGMVQRKPKLLVADMMFMENHVIYTYLYYIDDKHRQAFAYTYRNKQYVYDTFEATINTLKVMKFPVERFSADNDWCTKRVKEKCVKDTINTKWTAPYTHFHASLIERFNRSIGLIIGRMLVYSRLPRRFLPFLVDHGILIFNKQKSGNKEVYIPTAIGNMVYYKLKENKERIPGTPGVFMGVSTKHSYGTILVSPIINGYIHTPIPTSTYKVTHSTWFDHEAQYKDQAEDYSKIIILLNELAEEENEIIAEDILIQSKTNSEAIKGEKEQAVEQQHRNSASIATEVMADIETFGSSKSLDDNNSCTESVEEQVEYDIMTNTPIQDNLRRSTSIVKAPERYNCQEINGARQLGTAISESSEDVISSTERVEEQAEDDTMINIPIQDELRRSTRIVKEPDRYNCQEINGARQLGKVTIYAFKVQQQDVISFESEEDMEFRLYHKAFEDKRILQLRELVKWNTGERPPVEEKPPKGYSQWKQMEHGMLKQKLAYAMELDLRTATAGHHFKANVSPKHQDELYIMGNHGCLIPTVSTFKRGRLTHSIWEYKYKSDKCKARSCILGNTMPKQPGVDNFSPTMRPESDRLITCYGAKHRYPIHTFDVVSAFPQAERPDTLLLAPIPGMEDILGFTKEIPIISLICIKNRQGTDDGPIIWYCHLDKTMLELNFERSPYDPCVYMKSTLIVGIHADDGKVSGSMAEVEKFEKDISNKLEVELHGSIHKRTFLNQKYHINTEGIYVEMIDYATKIIEEHHMDKVKPKQAPTLSQPLGFPLKGIKQDQEYKHLKCREYVGALQHLATLNRLDIAHATNGAARWNHCYDEEVLKHIKCIFAYLTTYPHYGLFYPYGADTNIKEFNTHRRGIKAKVTNPTYTYMTTDTSYTGGKHQDISGVTVKIAGGIITWNSKKIPACHASPAESEAKGISIAVSIGVWIVNQARWMKLLDNEAKVRVYTDNTTALQCTQRPPGSSRKLSHIDVKVAFAQYHIERTFHLKYKATNLLESDCLTKGMGKTKTGHFRDQLLHKIPEELIQAG